MEEFLRLPTVEKVTRWKSMTREEKQLFVTTRAKEINSFNSPLNNADLINMNYILCGRNIYRDEVINVSQIHSFTEEAVESFISGNINLLYAIKIFNIPYIDKIICNKSFEEYIKICDYGYYRMFFDTYNTVKTIKDAWIYGRELNDIFSSVHITDEDILLFLKYLPMPNPLKISYISGVLHKCRYDINRESENMGLIIKRRIRYFLLEVNSRGVNFIDIKHNAHSYSYMNKPLTDLLKHRFEYYNGDREDINGVMQLNIKNIPLVKHLNHINLLPKNFYCLNAYPDLKEILKEESRFPYPKFNRNKYYKYPRDLKTIIFSTLCWYYSFRKIYRVSDKNLIYLILDYVVFNYYLDLEEKIKEWNVLSDKYRSIKKETFRERCIDSFIYSDFAPEFKALNDISGYNMRSPLINFDLYSIKNIYKWKALKGKHSLTDKLIQFCYKHDIAMTLIRKGKIKLNEKLEIIDLGEAVRLSKVKREKDKEKGLNLLKSEESMTKRIKLE